MAETTSPAGSDEPAAGAEGPRRKRPLLRLLQLVSLGVVASLLALLIWRVTKTSKGADLVAAIRADKQPPAPAFLLGVIWPHTETWPAALRPLAAGKVSPRRLRPYPVVLNFWASWCVPCKAEAPLLVASANANKGRVAFLGLDVQDFTSDARHFLRRFKANYVSVRDGSDATYSRYGLTGVPETYFIDRRGRIVAHVIGQITKRTLEEGVRLAREGSS
jgi:cytochrome c biogenesis protein CcmG, thiol:disulfide interchange protein DsbE